MTKKDKGRVVGKKSQAYFRSKATTGKTKSVTGSAFSQSSGYRCPNCDGNKPTLRGVCPLCGAKGNH